MVGAIAGAAVQGIAAGVGAWQSAKAIKDLRDRIQSEKKENKKWYEARMAEDYMQRADVQNALRLHKNLLGETLKRSRATNVVAGGTDESLALQQQAALDSLGETTATIAGQAVAHDEEVEREYRQTDAALDQQLMNLDAAKAQNIAAAAGQVGKAVSGLTTSGLDSVTTPKVKTPKVSATLDTDAIADEALAEATAIENYELNGIRKEKA